MGKITISATVDEQIYKKSLELIEQSQGMIRNKSHLIEMALKDYLEKEVEEK